MPSKISQIELNGVLYDVKDSEALKILNDGNQNEIVVLSNSDNEVLASGTTLAEIFSRIDTATIVDNVENGEWIINIVNTDGSIDMSNYYSKSRVDQLIAEAVASVQFTFTEEQIAVLSSGITQARVTSYDSHINDTAIHFVNGEKESFVRRNELADYATNSSVTESVSEALEDYVSSDELDSKGFATQAWVTQNEYLTAGDLDDYVDESTLQDTLQGYIIDVKNSEGVSVVAEGVATLPPPPAVPISDINENTAARHTHNNKSVLDKLGENNGVPTYNGNQIGAITDVRNSDGLSLVTGGIATIPEVTVPITDVVDSSGNSIVNNSVAQIPVIPELPTDENMISVISELVDIVVLDGDIVTCNNEVLAV